MYPVDFRVNPGGDAAEDTLWLQNLPPCGRHSVIFGEGIKLPRITEVTRAHCLPHLIINLSAQPDKGTPIVNYTTDREITPESMYFGRSFPRIQQTIWEADPTEGPVCVSKLGLFMLTKSALSSHPR